MHLKQIKLAGFKSFVEPTTISLSQNLTGVVGPNGCGKSNVIDAVRWVMGESSARYLRGESLTDVIFNGSSERHAVSQATIELVFNNYDGQIGGQWASYREISVKRQLDREGRSVYFLNGTRCRRRDIADIFLGTGLGPRSYAIIEQGMITRIIEAKPLELRSYLEEVSGLTKYKERRRETENRLSHTRDNLTRLSDLLGELSSQLDELQKQAQVAQQYRELKQQQRWLQGQQQAWQWCHYQQQCRDIESQIHELEQQYKQLQTQSAQIQAQLDQAETQIGQHQSQYQDCYQRYYQLSVDVQQIEDTIKRYQTTIQQLQKQSNDLKQKQQQVEQSLEQEKQYYQEVSEKYQEIEPQVDELAQTLQHKRESYQNYRQQWQEQYQAYNKLYEQLAHQRQEVQSKHNQIDLAQQQYRQAQQRLQQIDHQLNDIEKTELTESQRQIEQQLNNQLEQEQIEQHKIDELTQTIQSLEHQYNQLKEYSNQYQTQISELQGEISSLTTMLQEHSTDEYQQEWIHQQQLHEHPRLFEVLEVEPGYEPLIERALAPLLQGRIVDDEPIWPLNSHTALPKHITLVDQSSNRETVPGSSLPLYRLSHYVKNSQAVVIEYLQTIWMAETEQIALSYREYLKPFESIMTPSGLWLGRHWLDYKSEHLQDHNSLLYLQKQLADKQAQLQTFQENYSHCQTQLTDIDKNLKNTKNEYQQVEQKVKAIQTQIMDARSELKVLTKQQQQYEYQKKTLEQEQINLNQQLEKAQLNEQQAQAILEQTQQDLKTLEENKQQSYQTQQQLSDYLEQLHQEVETIQQQYQQVLLKQQHLSSESKRHYEKIQENKKVIKETQDELYALDEQWIDEASIETYRQKLQKQLDEQSQYDQYCRYYQQQIQQEQTKQQDLKKQLQQIYEQIQQKQNQLETMRMHHQEQVTRQNTVYEQLCTHYDNSTIERLTNSLHEFSSEQAINEPLKQVTQKIKQLGAVNLAAIDEYDQQYQRYSELKQQHDDVENSLQTLQEAIQTIDQETRQRFKTTFEKVNATFQTLFPKIFEGGQASLVLTEDNWLTTGITIQARPPGKRNNSIHMLSGGEKALTALALVFSLFEMNPAPFCFLDEVDAPLDDQNVTRFCEIVRQLNDRVQFLFVTHNKMTMEMAQQLIGVTMKEPGVSRIVSVNVDKALEWSQNVH